MYKAVVIEYSPKADDMAQKVEEKANKMAENTSQEGNKVNEDAWTSFFNIKKQEKEGKKYEI